MPEFKTSTFHVEVPHEVVERLGFRAESRINTFIGLAWVHGLPGTDYIKHDEDNKRRCCVYHGKASTEITKAAVTVIHLLAQGRTVEALSYLDIIEMRRSHAAQSAKARRESL